MISPCEYRKKSFEEYLKLLSQKKPCPGGGSASLGALALANALVCMVANYSIDSSRVSPKHRRQLRTILDNAYSLGEKILDAVGKDSELFIAIQDSFRKAKKDPLCQSLFHDALKDSILLHLTALSWGIKIITWNHTLLTQGNPNLASDARVSASLTSGSFQGLKTLIHVNLKEIPADDPLHIRFLTITNHLSDLFLQREAFFQEMKEKNRR
jgi:formiminotetrahydrofolate cyclodeaminase